MLKTKLNKQNLQNKGNTKKQLHHKITDILL
jgi:hypothetical protein